VVTSVALYLAGLGLVALQRVFELTLSQRHARRALARGGVEVGQGHLRAMSALHTAFFFGCAIEVWALGRPFVASVGVPIIVVPGTPVVTSGPYRWLRHPNYLAVVLEGVAIPMIHGAWWTAMAFSIANAALLRVRIRCEERALADHCDYAARFATRSRWLPGVARSTT
jgi:methyltransferase